MPLLHTFPENVTDNLGETGVTLQLPFTKSCAVGGLSIPETPHVLSSFNHEQSHIRGEDIYCIYRYCRPSVNSKNLEQIYLYLKFMRCSSNDNVTSAFSTTENIQRTKNCVLNLH